MAKCPDCKKDFKINHACTVSGKSYKTEIVESRAGSPKKINASNDLPPPPKNLKDGVHSIADDLGMIMKADTSEGGYLGEDSGGNKDMEMFVAIATVGERWFDKWMASKKEDREREDQQEDQGGLFGGGANWNAQQMAAQAGLRGNFVTTDGMISAGGQTSGAPPKKNANSPIYGTANKSSLPLGEALERMDLEKVFKFWELHEVEIWWMLYPLAIEAAGENLALIQMADTKLVLEMIKRENNFFATHLSNPYVESQFIKLIDKLKEHLDREGDRAPYEVQLKEEIAVVDDGSTDNRLPPPPRGWRDRTGRVSGK